MADNSALFYAVAGIVFMSMIVPMVLNPLPGTTSYVRYSTTFTGYASARPTSPPVTCVDHDGNDIYTNSYVTYKNVNYVDSCSGSSVNEMLCIPGKGGKLEKSSANYACTYGCDNGKCLSKPIPVESCADTDQGFIQEIAGTVSGQKADGSYYSYSDNCPSIYRLVEYYCYNNQPFFADVNCTPIMNGTTLLNYVCENGTCNIK